MDLTDKLFDHLVATDIVKLREDLERKGVLEGAYLERFSRGEYFVPFVISFFNANFYRRIIDHYRANQSFTSRWICYRLVIGYQFYRLVIYLVGKYHVYIHDNGY